jgi:hypothetical protein
MNAWGATGLILFAALTPAASEWIDKGPHQLRFHPADGSRLALDYERVLELELTDTSRSIIYDDEEQPVEEDPGPEVRLSETESIRFADTIGMADGDIVSLRRTFEHISNTYTQQISSPDTERIETENVGTSKLEGVTLNFVRDSDTDDFRVTFADGSSALDEQLLIDLDPRANLAGFLPGAAVDVGDSWEVEIGSFVNMTNLGGDLKVIQEGEEDGEDSAEYGRIFDDNLKGRIVARLKEVSDAAGERVAKISIEMALTTAIDLATQVDSEEATGQEEESHAIELDLDGELLWNLDTEVAHSLEISGDVEIAIRSKSSYEFNGHTMVIEESQDLDGTIQYSASFE